MKEGPKALCGNCDFEIEIGDEYSGDFVFELQGEILCGECHAIIEEEWEGGSKE